MGCQQSRNAASSEDLSTDPNHSKNRDHGDNDQRHVASEKSTDKEKNLKNGGRTPDQKTGKRTAQNKKKRKNAKENGHVVPPESGAILVGNKLATTHEDVVYSPPMSNGGGLYSRDDGFSEEEESVSASLNNGSICGAPNAGSESPVTSDKLHKNFQERLITTQLAKNGQKLTDSQLDFFRMLDERIDRGKDYRDSFSN